MGKQPYIPLYVGDYLKDTRVLPLSVRGAWVDLILFMWDNPVRGELTGTIEEFSRLMSCDPKEAEFALNLLKQKKTADIDLLPGGIWRIVSRRMKHDHAVSVERSIAGRKGVSAKKVKPIGQPIAEAKQKQNTEYDIDNDIEDESIIVIGEKKDFHISIKPKYIHDKPVIVYDLPMYFKIENQLEALTSKGWTKFSEFMSDNPGKVFDDHDHVYNTYRLYHTRLKPNGKGKLVDLTNL